MLTASKYAEDYAAELESGEETLDSEHMLEVSFTPTDSTVTFLRCCGGPRIWVEADVNYRVDSGYAQILTVTGCRVGAHWAPDTVLVEVSDAVLDKVRNRLYGELFKLDGGI